MEYPDKIKFKRNDNWPFNFSYTFQKTNKLKNNKPVYICKPSKHHIFFKNKELSICYLASNWILKWDGNYTKWNIPIITNNELIGYWTCGKVSAIKE